MKITDLGFVVAKTTEEFDAACGTPEEWGPHDEGGYLVVSALRYPTIEEARKVLEEAMDDLGFDRDEYPDCPIFRRYAQCILLETEWGDHSVGEEVWQFDTKPGGFDNDLAAASEHAFPIWILDTFGVSQ